MTLQSIIVWTCWSRIVYNECTWIFIDFVRCRWNRLENLLVQGRKDRDFSAKEALQPVLKVLLSPDGEVLRNLVIKEAIRVTEAFTLGTISETYRYVPDFLRSIVFNGNAKDPLMMSETEMQSMVELRDQVIRIWRNLQSSNDFDPSILLPILQVRISICNSQHHFISANHYVSNSLMEQFA
jgi:hypothetical protein